MDAVAYPPGCSVLRDGGLVERGPDAARQFQGVVVSPKMNEEHARLLVEHVTVDRRHFDIGSAQDSNQWIDLIAGNQKIAGDGCLAAARRLKVDGVGATKCAAHLHPVFRGWIAPGNPELVDTAVGRALRAHRFVELRGVEIDDRSRTSGGCR